MDRINIKNLEVFAKHGVIPEENILGQKFIVSVALYTNLRDAGKTGELTKTLDYTELCHSIKAYVEENTFTVIESVAENLAEKLLIGNPLLRKVWLEVKKPWAPVAVHLETISVEIERSMHSVYISIGSNIGDREEHLMFAMSEIEGTRGCRVTSTSDFLKTKPYGNTEQDDFLNCCIAMETIMGPQELLNVLQGIEDKAGRVRGERWGPRTLDADIIFYDDIIFSSERLRIPHADMHNRRFVLEPLCEIAPWKLHPVLNKTAAEMLSELEV
jgi:dihydroneopterin aldolase/2-amino-4-hydroxy-6-hydroxymethyldihydropteridine diphosphokinase